MADAARLAEELRHEQEHSAQIERLRRALESQVPAASDPDPSVSDRQGRTRGRGGARGSFPQQLHGSPQLTILYIIS